MANLKNIANPKILIRSANNFLENSKIVYSPRIVVKSKKNILEIDKRIAFWK